MPATPAPLRCPAFSKVLQLWRWWRQVANSVVLGLVLLGVVSSPHASETVALAVKVSAGDGAPIAGALVALVPPGGALEKTRHGVADQEGRFEISVPAGTYAVTATSPGRREVYVPGVKVPSSDGSELGIVMRPGGRLIRGELVSSRGEPLRGAQVAFGRVSEQDGDLFMAAVTGNRFEITLSDGDYVAAALVSGGPLLTKSVRVEENTVELVLRPEPRPTPAPDAVTTWIKEHIIPLRTIAAGTDFADLLPFGRIVGDARVVSLGEATHGTREFFQMKHRLVEFMVEELGFTLFGIEANLTEARVVNEYVLHGRGDPAVALKGLYFWTWDTEEVLEMLRWMRRYNARVPIERQVRFFGFDMQEPQMAFDRLRDYLRQVSPTLAREMDANVSPIVQLRTRKPSSPTVRADIDRSLRRIDQSMLNDRKAYVEHSTNITYADARQDLDVLRQFLDMVSSERMDALNARDSAMASNVLSTLERYPEARAALWAHNGHIANAPFAGGAVTSMGMHLRRALGAQTVAVGFVFRHGAFQAYDGTPERRGLVAFSVEQTPAATLTEALASANSPIAVVDLRTLPRDGPVARWFADPQTTRQAGAVFAPTDNSILPERFAQSYDALVFIESTTRARANP